MKKNSIMIKIRRAFLLVCLVSLTASSVITLISLLNIRLLTLEESGNIGTMAAEHSAKSLQDQTVADLAELVQAKSGIIDRDLRKAVAGLEFLKGYIERIYSNKEEFRPLRIPNYRAVPPGEMSTHWFFSYGTVQNPSYSEDDLRRTGLLENAYLLGNLDLPSRLTMKNIPDISSIYFAEKSGLNIQHDAAAALKAQAFSWAAGQRPWYTSVRDRDGLYISDTYSDPAGRGLCVTMSVPVHGRAGEFMGAAGIDITIADMDENIRKTVVGKNGYALLIDNRAGEGGRGSRIVSAPALTGENENDMASYLGENADNMLTAMKAAPSGYSQSVIRAGEKNTGVYIIWAAVDLTGWQLAYVMPEEDILAPALNLHDDITGLTERSIRRIDRLIVTALLISGAILLLIIFLTSGAARFIAGRMIRPITVLNGGLRNIGAGNLDYHADIHTGDEIEELSLSFERMTVELKSYIENLGRVTAEKERIGAELNVATKIQASMLPRLFPAFPDRKEFDLFASMLPAKEVGGDFYDFFLINEDTLAFLIADVSGKGVPSALFMVIAKTLIKNNAQYGLSPKEVFEAVNNLLCKDNEEQMFVTAFMAYLDIPSGKLTCVNAGHNPPLIIRGGNVEWFKIKHGLVLGCMEDVFYKEEETVLKPGDKVYLYTDGVTEAMNSGKELFSEDRLLKAAASHKDQGVKEMVLSIKQEIDAFAGDAEQADDITMLVLQYTGDTEEEWKELKIKALPENLDAVLDFVNRELEKTGCPLKTRTQIDLAVEEIFVNIARYAYNPETGWAVIRARVSAHEIRLEFEDEGNPYNPLEKTDPDITAVIDDRPIGGLGVFLVKKIMDTVDYRYTGSSNLLALKKMFEQGT